MAIAVTLDLEPVRRALQAGGEVPDVAVDMAGAAARGEADSPTTLSPGERVGLAVLLRAAKGAVGRPAGSGRSPAGVR